MNDTTIYSNYYKNFISWKINERKYLKDIEQNKDNINSMNSSQLTIMIVNIFVCLVVSIILTMSEVCNLLGKEVPCFGEKGEEEKLKIKNTKAWISYCAKII